MTSEETTWTDRLQWSVRALAQPMTIQRTLFPEFVCLADELALDFEESLGGVRNEPATLPPDVMEAILRLDEQLERMSGPQNADLWTDDALRRSPEWGTVRSLAAQAVRLANWAASPPGPNPQLFIGPVC
jgi:hypothetical protein